MVGVCFSLFPLSPELHVGSQGTSSSGSSHGKTSSASPLLDVVTNSALELSDCGPDDTVILELVSCGSDDTVILDEDYSPSRKRQKEDQDAKHIS